MNLHHLAKAAATSLVLATASLGASANLLTNGDFEADVGDVADGSYATVAAGSGTIDGWTVSGLSVDLIRNNYGAISNVSVDLAGTPGPGILSQTFAAVVGQAYELKFDYFKNSPGALMGVTFGDAVLHLYNPAPLVAPATATLAWVSTFTGQATVSFSGMTDYYGPTLDNVSVTAVPEPETYAMMLAGLGALGFMARRRNKA